jgi:hypothetical protein
VVNLIAFSGQRPSEQPTYAGVVVGYKDIWALCHDEARLWLDIVLFWSWGCQVTALWLAATEDSWLTVGRQIYCEALSSGPTR